MNRRTPTFVRRDVFTGPAVVLGSGTGLWIRFAKRYLASRMGALARRFSVSQGSREHYYHFLVGYLLPLVHAQMHHRFAEFRVLDCGPLMTPILRETLQRLGHQFEIVGPDAITNAHCLELWDHAEFVQQPAQALRDAAGRVRDAWREHECPAGNCDTSTNLLIKRSSPHEFYMQGRAENEGHGTSRRGIINLQEVSEFLTREEIPHSVYDAGEHSLGCQINVFGRARRILGMRGADWANLAWAQPGVRVRMLDPHPPATLIGNFMGHLGIQPELLIVAESHVALDPADALEFFTKP